MYIEDRTRPFRTSLLALFLLMTPLLVLSSRVAYTQDEAAQKTTTNRRPPQGEQSIKIPCNGGTDILGQGNGVAVKIIFLFSDRLSGCSAILDCPDVTPNPTYTFPPGEGPYVFGCGNGRVRATAGPGAGFLILSADSAD